ncbi:hypothetical protein MUK42_16358 [Musa troglodytarum]|uniref:Uncharacterized protein n=1 Tax=Musa troglodytarum TaxID=320322 RepID=A0A9E7HQY1_9LILI|nr:hypothetical protein MUK42_16358 [Musa troglodytarum]
MVNPGPSFSCFSLSSPAPDCVPLGSLHQCWRRWWSSSGEGEPTGNRKKSPLRLQLRLRLWVAMASRNRWRRSRRSSSAEKSAGTTGWPAKLGHLQVRILWPPFWLDRRFLAIRVFEFLLFDVCSGIILLLLRRTPCHVPSTALWIEDEKVLNTF